MKKQMIFLVSALVLILGSACKKAVEMPFQAEENIFVQGASIHGANGIIFDSNDQLHIASALGMEILVMDTETGDIIKRFGVDLGVKGPDDLIFGPDGSLYWTDIAIGEVGRLSPDGVKTRQFVAPGVNPITFSDDGRLFVALDFFGDALYELDPELKNPPRLIAENLGWLNGFDFGPDGFLYGPIIKQGKVVRIDVDADTFTIETVSEGFGPGAAKFDSKGHLYAISGKGKVFRIDTKSGNRDVIASIPHKLDNLAFDSRDRLFVSSFSEGSIFQVYPDERDPSKKTRLVSKGGMICPGGVAVTSRAEGESSVFVTDWWSFREFNGQTGQQVNIEFDYLVDPSGLSMVFTVFPDGDNLVLSSYYPPHVQVWNPEKRETQINYDFSGPPSSAVPLNAIRFQGNLVIADLMSGSVFSVTDGNADDRKVLAEGLKVPAGLAASGGDLWISDWATGDVWQIAEDGVPLSPPKSVATDLKFPEGLAVDLDGSLLVVETGTRRLLRLDPDTGEVSIMAEGLEVGAEAPPEWPPTLILSSVAVDPSGAIYVTGEIANVLYCFKRQR